MAIRKVKIRVNSKAESGAVQAALFQDGCQWTAGGSRYAQYTEKPFLYVDLGGSICFGESESRFAEDDYRELKFQFVTTVKAVPEVRKTVSLFGKLYDAEELQDALDTLKPVTV